MQFPIAAALAALATLSPLAANAQGVPYRAAGTEPFWSLTIDAGTMRFEALDRPAFSVPTPPVINGFAGDIYRTRRINVNVVHARCSNGMSGATFPDTVTVTVDGRAYKGCGGETARQSTAAVEGEWRVVTINGRPAITGAPATVRFQGDRISGNTGCNAFGGSFRLERDTLTAGPLISTKRACTRFNNQQERDLLDLLGQRLSVRILGDGRMALAGRGGGRLVLDRLVRMLKIEQPARR